jgi:hypothetical protein
MTNELEDYNSDFVRLSLDLHIPEVVLCKFCRSKLKDWLQDKLSSFIEVSLTDLIDHTRAVYRHSRIGSDPKKKK